MGVAPPCPSTAPDIPFIRLRDRQSRGLIPGDGSLSIPLSSSFRSMSQVCCWVSSSLWPKLPMSTTVWEKADGFLLGAMETDDFLMKYVL